MKKNKIILKHCPNFYKIINFEYYEDDYISGKMVQIYNDYIFNIDLDNKENIDTLKQLDLIINKYIEDYYFRKEMQFKMINIKVKQSNNIINDIVKGIINCFVAYEEGYSRSIYFARWI